MPYAALIAISLALCVHALVFTLFLPLSPFMIHSPSLPENNNSSSSEVLLKEWKNVGYFSGITGFTYIGNALSFSKWDQFTIQYGAKKVVLFSLFSIAAVMHLFSYSSNYLFIICMRFLLGLLNGIIPAARLYLPKICSLQPHTVISTTWNIGLVVGPGAVFLFSWIHRENSPDIIHSSMWFGSVSALLTLLIAMVALVDVSLDKLRCDGLKGNDKQGMIIIDIDSRSSNKNSHNNGNHVDDRQSSASLQHIQTTRPQPNLDLPHTQFFAFRTFLPQAFHLCSEKSGSLVWYEQLGKASMNKLIGSASSNYDIRHHYLYLMQFAIQKLKADKIIGVIDLEGSSLRATQNADICFIIVQDLLCTYPNRLEKLVVINTPFWFSFVWARMKKKMPQSTVKKVIMMRSTSAANSQAQEQQLIEIIGENALPEQYGGKSKVDIGRSEPDIVLQQWIESSNAKSDAASRAIPNQIEENDDSDEEDFYECSEYGLEREEEEELMIPRIAPSSNFSTSSSSSSSSSRKTNSISDIRSLWKVHQLGPMLLISGAWFFLQSGFDELLALWSLYKQFQNGFVDVVSPGSIASVFSITAVALLGFEYYLFPQFKRDLVARWNSSYMKLFRIISGCQILLLMSFPLLVGSWASWLLCVVCLIMNYWLRSIAFEAVVNLLDDHYFFPGTSKSQYRSQLRRGTSAAELLSRGAGCILCPILFSFILGWNVSHFVEQTLVFMVLGAIQTVIISFTYIARTNFITETS